MDSSVSEAPLAPRRAPAAAASSAKIVVVGAVSEIEPLVEVALVQHALVLDGR